MSLGLFSTCVVCEVSNKEYLKTGEIVRILNQIGSPNPHAQKAVFLSNSKNIMKNGRILHFHCQKLVTFAKIFTHTLGQ